jgi:hypothetical protein
MFILIMIDYFVSILQYKNFQYKRNGIGGVMVSVLVSSVIDRGSSVV